MNDAVKHRTLPGSLRDDPIAPASSGLSFKTNTSRPGGLSKQQVLLLIAVSALIHGGAWWFFQQAKAEPLPTPPQIPETVSYTHL
ncbi:energy transducer TonB, partial [Pseudomonas sp. Dout3]|nr:energy transducer TonB [Pseudomonas sp. Dout3]